MRIERSVVAVVAGTALALASSLASAQPEVAKAELPGSTVDDAGAAAVAMPDEVNGVPERDRRTVGHPVDVAIEAGPRFVVVSDAGLDPYSADDVLAQASFDVAYTPFEIGSLEVGAVAGYTIGHTSGLARGDATGLTTHRMALGLLGRVWLTERFAVRAQIVPSAQYLRASIEDPFVPRPLVAHAWTYGLDTAVGLAVRLGSVENAEERVASFWLAGDFGYSFAGSAPMKFAVAQDEDDPREYGTVQLPDVQLGGPATRLAFGVAF